MAQVRVSLEFLADRLFGFSQNPVVIKDARFFPEKDCLEFEIDGVDVPADALRVHAQFTVTQNRAGEKFHALTFEPATVPDWEFYEVSRDPVSGGSILASRQRTVR